MPQTNNKGRIGWKGGDGEQEQGLRRKEEGGRRKEKLDQDGER